MAKEAKPEIAKMGAFISQTFKTGAVSGINF